MNEHLLISQIWEFSSALVKGCRQCKDKYFRIIQALLRPYGHFFFAQYEVAHFVVLESSCSRRKEWALPEPWAYHSNIARYKPHTRCSFVLTYKWAPLLKAHAASPQRCIHFLVQLKFNKFKNTLQSIRCSEEVLWKYSTATHLHTAK